jgi:lipopolysaccharide transport system ATP-binding protein
VSSTVVRGRNVSKSYRIGQREPYTALRDVITSGVRAPFRTLARRDRAARPVDRIWALDDVSFDVAEGEVLGLIGANGAGKSTLLKVLSRITEPTRGRIELHGRVGSLLEIGTGFHPELTGRENVYLNGSILGMRRAEIDRQFDAIVDFSGNEAFLDTPVKRYSSGMQVRLAFAVAAHLQPEILLVDEVLAVGDAQFQQKCLGKMEDVTANEGRTVIFVSHNLASVRRLCSRSLVLERGRLVFDGETDEAVARYLATEVEHSESVVAGEALARRLVKTRVYSDTPYFRCDRMLLLDESGVPRNAFGSDEEVTLVVEWEALKELPQFRVLVVARDANDVALLRTESVDDPSQTALFPLMPGRYRSSCALPANLFGSTRLRLGVNLVAEVMQVLDYEDVFDVAITFQGLNENVRSEAHLRPQLPWTTELVRDAEPVR